jgi:hypothetical protein
MTKLETHDTSHDENFDQTSLDRLATQYLTKNTTEGRVLFLSDSKDNRIDHARLQLADADHDVLKGSGFKLHLMELLDILLIYRAQHCQPDSSRGVVRLFSGQMSIEWLSKTEFEELYEDFH